MSFMVPGRHDGELSKQVKAAEKAAVVYGHFITASAIVKLIVFVSMFCNHCINAVCTIKV